MHALRSKFAPEVTEEPEPETEDDTLTSASTVGMDSEEDYFGFEGNSRTSLDIPTPGVSSRRRSVSRGSSYDLPRTSSPAGMKTPGYSPRVPSSLSRSFSHSNVSAGDLHTSTSANVENTIETYRPHHSNSAVTPGVHRSSRPLPTPLRKAARLPTDISSSTILVHPPAGDFNLRDEVMACIAKSIGLIQPPISSSPSVDASPVIVPSDAQSGTSGRRFPNSFGSLSFLETGAVDDSASTMTGASATGQPYALGLDNEVEILCFAAGSTLVRAGERHAGSIHRSYSRLTRLTEDWYFRDILRYRWILGRFVTSRRRYSFEGGAS